MSANTASIVIIIVIMQSFPFDALHYKRCILSSLATLVLGKMNQNGNDNPICKTEKETQMYRTDFWTIWEKARVG